MGWAPVAQSADTTAWTSPPAPFATLCRPFHIDLDPYHTHMQTHDDLRRMSVEQLEEEASDTKALLATLRQRKGSGDVAEDDIRTAKKDLARILTIRREVILMQSVEMHMGTPVHKLPKILRPRLNKAKRAALTRAQARRRSERQRARASRFPRLIFSYNQ